MIIPNTTSFYLDKNQDDFWNDYACKEKGICYYEDSLFPEAIEANKSRMEEVMKKVESVRGITSGTGSQDPQTSMHMNEIGSRFVEECCRVTARIIRTEEGIGKTYHHFEGFVKHDE